ncbi:MAG TPA: hypothetical protein VFI11_09460, partial [Anaerolineales bacterium]|nr:hypothetical protein [Anaerolineales bacterium]
ACGLTPPAPPTPEFAAQPSAITAVAPRPSATALAPLNLASDGETIRLRMLHSHENWRSIWAQLHAVVPLPEGTDDFIRLARLQVWIRQPNEVLLLRGSFGDADPDYFFVSNGFRFLEANLVTGETQEAEVLPGILPPFSDSEETTDPISIFAIGRLIFPAGLSQRRGTYEVIGEATVAGRGAVIVDFTPQATGLIVDRFHIDALTGVLLRHQVLDLSGGDERVVSDVSLAPIIYDAEFDPGLFRLAIPDNVHFQEGPEWNAIGDWEDMPPIDSY